MTLFLTDSKRGDAARRHDHIAFKFLAIFQDLGYWWRQRMIAKRASVCISMCTTSTHRTWTILFLFEGVSISMQSPAVRGTGSIFPKAIIQHNFPWIAPNLIELKCPWLLWFRTSGCIILRLKPEVSQKKAHPWMWFFLQTKVGRWQNNGITMALLLDLHLEFTSTKGTEIYPSHSFAFGKFLNLTVNNLTDLHKVRVEEWQLAPTMNGIKRQCFLLGWILTISHSYHRHSRILRLILRGLFHRSFFLFTVSFCSTNISSLAL